MTEHIETRNKVKGIVEIQTFSELLNKCILSDEEREIMKLHYLSGKNFSYIGDLLGYSESSIKKKHKKILKKLNKII